MIDLHTHILPGVDDGVRTEDEAVEFAKAACADGTRRMVATPHCKEGYWQNPRETVLADVATLQATLQREQVELEILPGAEVHLCPDLVERVADGRAVTLADNGKTLLLELSLSQYPVELESLIFQLKLAGIEPLFAHPERIRYFQDDATRFESAVRLGAYGQITTGSITGIFGRDVQEYSEELLCKGLVHVLATDSHNLRGRPPIMSVALPAMASLIGEERTSALCHEGPLALIEGREPQLPEVELGKRGRPSLLSRLFRRK
jgi:protein-tyrosine phosphatase